MQDKEVIKILRSLLEKRILTEKEEEAVREAIGILSWTKLGESRIKNIAHAQKAKREKMRQMNYNDK